MSAEAKERVITERAELQKKRAALFAFMETPVYRQLPSVQQDLLGIQVNAMTSYADILSARLVHWGDV